MSTTRRRNNKALPSSLSVQQQANKVRLGRSTAGPSMKVVGFVFAVVVVMALIYSSSTAQNLPEMLQQIAEGKVHEHQQSKPTELKLDAILTGSKVRNVCQNTKHLFKGMDYIEAAYKEAEAFHNGGGNLKQVEKYLNDNIDETLKVIGSTFTPAGAKEPFNEGQSISGEIKKLYVINDKYKRGGYDQRAMPGNFNPANNPNMRGGGTKRNPNRYVFDVIEPVKNHARWSAGLGPITDLCKNVNKIEAAHGGSNGKQQFEDKFMCSFDELRNTTKSPPPSIGGGDVGGGVSCEIISIGSNGEWGFENTIAETTGCSTHTFDCTVTDPRKPDTNSIHFYPYCAADKHKKVDDREYFTYSNIIEKSGLTKPPTLFKMDVEGFEYDVFTQMINEAELSGSKDMLPSQISVELHYATRMYDLPWMMRQRQAGEIAMFSGIMYRKGGYLPVFVKYFQRCDACVELLFVRVFCD